MSDRLKGKVALITGGTSGIGAATAELFIKEGATVVITGRSVEKGQGLAESLGPNASYREADVMEEAAIADCIGYTTSTHGKLDILFNNAGGPVGAPLEQLTQKHIDYGVKLLLSSAMLGSFDLPYTSIDRRSLASKPSAVSAHRRGQSLSTPRSAPRRG